MKNILGIGNALVDVLVKTKNDQLLKELQLPEGSMQLIDAARYHQVSERFATLAQHRSTGGSACNTLLAIASLGGKASLIGKVGTDDMAQYFADTFHEKGVKTRLLTDNVLPTGVASTIITPGGQRTFATHLGAAATLHASDLKAEWFTGQHYLYIEGYLVEDHELLLQAASMAHAAGMLVCIDLASYNVVADNRDFFHKFLPQTDIVFANEQEAEAFGGQKDIEKNVEALSAICPMVAVKIGKNGVIVCQDAKQEQYPAMEVENVVDTTAAGDYFAAGFLYGHATGKSTGECAALGSLLAGHIIQTIGTALPESTWKEIRAHLL